ncbi:MAG: IgGFc-binding protein [Myxococcales bacterium]|nr:IgGFc-binding protein [Myxococcota bacterium]MDW8281441.1 IgGFc-binding protein [Myxococcales bacterium]
MFQPPPPCVRGSTRCLPDRTGVEFCDGTGWLLQQRCDTLPGQRCDAGRCIGPCDQLPPGNVGCVFYPANLWSTSDAGDFGIVATNTSDRLAAEVTLSDATGLIEKQTAMPGGVVIFRLPHGRNKLIQTEQAQKGFVLRSTAPVSVYQFHPIDAARVYSGSATLLLPEQVLARTYFVISYTYNAELLTTPPQGQGFVAVVATQDGTQVEITVPVQTKPGAGVPGVPAGGTLRRTLQRLEVLEVIQANSLEDISGAQVRASAPVVVFGGAGGVSIPRTAVGGNHLGIQMFPLETWGKRYLAAKLKQRNATDRDYYRILASVDGTRVTLAGPPGLPRVPELQRGTFFEFDTDADFEIVADHPIAVFQYMPAWGNLSGRYDPADFPDGVSPMCPYRTGPDNVRCIGDANMTPLVPVEQYRADYIFYVPLSYSYDYIQITAPLGTTLRLDGNVVNEPLRPIGTTLLGRAILRVRPGSHRIVGSMPMGLLGYGYAYATSYSYAGGLNLERINPIE